MNSVVLNICVQVFLWMCFHFSQAYTRSGIAALLFVLIQAFGDEKILCSLLREPVEVGMLVALILCVCMCPRVGCRVEQDSN